LANPSPAPTFALAQHYTDGNPPLIHLDLYRLEQSSAADDLFLQEDEEAKAIGALMAVEWPERLSLGLPEAWQLELSHIKDGGRRAQLTPPKNAST
jgi:tRNA threonylcarbamoyladenosine biosynthesis protein TsaE